jgi:glutathione S-transferase
MKCYVTANSPFARKVRVAAYETGLADEVEWQIITPAERAEIIPAINPLGKVPVAILEAGNILFDSPVICAYVDSLNNDHPKLIPEKVEQRWAVSTLEALGDGLGEAVVAASTEDSKPDDKRTQAIFDRQMGKITTALAALNKMAGDFNDPPMMGEIAVGCALGYMEFRNAVPGWRENYPVLSGWYTEILKRQSFIRTEPS